MGKKFLNGVSLFSSAGVGEAYLKDLGMNIKVANELLKDRADLYAKIYPETKVVAGDILDDKIYRKILDLSGESVDFLIATPPCQGMSVAGKNRSLTKMLEDDRNYLIFRVIDFIKKKKPSYILVENVPNFLKIELPYKGKLYKVIDMFNLIFGKEYEIESLVVDTSEYGVPQKRKRAILKLYKKGLKWSDPSKEKTVTVRQVIGKLPSLESGEKSKLKWHFARNHTPRQVEWMRYTPTGRSAFENKVHFPVKSSGERLKGYITTYRRMNWDEPAPTITMRNDAISSQMNVHPGNLTKDGTYSDARVLTPLELMLLSSLPKDWNIPEDTSEILLRKCLGESVPPMMIKKIMEGILK